MYLAGPRHKEGYKIFGTNYKLAKDTLSYVFHYFL